MRFHDRAEAGQFLAQELSKLQDTPNLIVLALPRGGVPVGFEIARALRRRSHRSRKAHENPADENQRNVGRFLQSPLSRKRAVGSPAADRRHRRIPSLRPA